jgi:hypothetical protein
MEINQFYVQVIYILLIKKLVNINLIKINYKQHMSLLKKWQEIHAGKFFSCLYSKLPSNLLIVVGIFRNSLSPVVIDNTNVTFWEIKPYVQIADKYDYIIIICEPRTPWKFDLDALSGIFI